MHPLRRKALMRSLALRVLAPVIVCVCVSCAWVATASAASQIALGVNTEEINTKTAFSLESFGSTVGVMPHIAMWYQDWTESWSTALIDPKFVDPTAELGAVPMITWQPDLDTGNPENQPAYTPAIIADGRYDAFIRRAAVETAAYKKPVLIRLAPEMNGSSTAAARVPLPHIIQATAGWTGSRWTATTIHLWTKCHG
jgi:hypothetical protein